MKWILSLVLLLTSVVATANDSAKVVATVNGIKIFKGTLRDYHYENLKLLQSNKQVTAEQSLNQLIDRIIGIQNGKKDKLNKRPDVVKKMNDIIYHAKISKDLEPRLKRIGAITDKDIEKYYKENPEYRTTQVLLRLPVAPKAQDVLNARNEAQKIYNEVIKKPKSFDGVAARFSDSANNITGGDLGYQPKARLSYEYYNAIKGKKVGTITKPFRSQVGFHVVKITGVKKLNQIDRKMYQKIVYDTKRDKILEGYFAEQRKKSKVKVNSKELKSL